MIHTATVRLALLGVLVCAALAQAQDKKPIVFEVVLPANATLEIGGYMTKSGGESRSFETPAVTPGKTYSYTIKAAAGGKQIIKEIILKTDSTLVFDLRADFKAATAKLMPKDSPANPGRTQGPQKPGFVTYAVDGRLWIFREGSKELKAFDKDGDYEKHVTRIEQGKTIKAPDGETISAFMLQPAGFEVFVDRDGRLWVFKAGSKELAQYKKDGDLEKHITRIKAGPKGMTIKAPDGDTIAAYMKVQPK